jgi:hypothetical protein
MATCRACQKNGRHFDPACRRRGAGIGVVNLIYPLLERRDWPDLHARAATLMKSLVGRAMQDGSLRSDLSERDVVFALVRFARPLAMGLPPAEERSLAHRHLDFYIDGLCARLPRKSSGR